MAAALIIIRMTKIIAIAATIITNIITTIRMKSIIAAVVMTILTRTNISTMIPTRAVIAAAVMIILTSIIMNTANAAVTKRSIRRTTMQATKIFYTTKKICPTS